MGNYRVITGQNIYDVALHLYGSIDGIVDLLINNPGLSLETELRTGQELTYTDGFIINADVVAYNEMHGIVPSNGERHVYPKHFTCPQTAVFSLSAALVSVQCEVSGTGTLEIDWGDDSAAETVILGHIPYTLHHTFDSRVRHKRKIRWFADASFRHIDWSGMTPSSVILLRELHVEELTLRGCTLALDGFRILSGTYRIDLSGSMVSDLLPLIECRGLMELDLSEVRIKPTVLDKYLMAIVECYGNRRNCRMTLPVSPTGTYREPDRDETTGRYRIISGMEAIWVILHEESWNEGGAWELSSTIKLIQWNEPYDQGNIQRGRCGTQPEAGAGRVCQRLQTVRHERHPVGSGGSIYSFETLLDVFAVDISEAINGRINGTPAYYANALLQYQQGDELTVREDGLAFGYPNVDETKRIITQVSYVESTDDRNLDSKLILKVATGTKGNLSAIPPEDLVPINAYIAS